jgi:hypothetical protein
LQPQDGLAGLNKEIFTTRFARGAEGTEDDFFPGRETTAGKKPKPFGLKIRFLNLPQA